ncbi:beta-1,6-N-acetylglucosaminyltransferase [Arcticibacter sp. MXS-1]|uniref:beta-1,6-N-acetylglucosaminyltransferase n=1 Tax=Arcticibacter sp. MXS-1 TaxID=3341726 RepID=UPI0035A91B1C
MSKVAYLIVAHTNPQQLSRLISRLHDDQVFFAVHISLTASSPLEDFQRELEKSVPAAKVEFTGQRYKGTWGSFNLVKIAIELIRTALKAKPAHLVLISGQDYPIKSRSDFYKLLEENRETIFMPFKLVDWPANKTNRINSYFFPDIFNYGKSDKALLLARIITFLLPKRTFPQGLTPYTGRYWCILPYDAAAFLLNEYDTNKELTRYFKYVLIPEEQYFHTILMNSSFSSRMKNFTVSFADYTGPRTPVWRREHLDLLKSQDSPFARRFDPGIDNEVMDAIDRGILC